MRRVQILFLSPRESWPLTSGARLRDFHLAQSLAEGATVTYVYLSREVTQSEMEMRLHSSRIVAVPVPSKYTVGKILRGLLGRYPLPVENYTSEPLELQLRNLLNLQTYDLVHLDSIHLCAYVPLIRQAAPAAKVSLDWHNIESELMTRYAESSASIPRRAYARLTAEKLRKFEDELLTSCDGHIVCSERERLELLRRSPNARVAVIQNGVDTQRFISTPQASVTDSLLFVGQLSYHANAEAIIRFTASVWPAVREAYPHLCLTIVGSAPPPAVLALRSHPGVEVHADVPDVLPFYQSALASIVPLQTGGGTRLKILEAMAAGAPVLSTSIGAEGLDVQDGIQILIVNNEPADWIGAIRTLLDDPRRSELVRSARELVCKRYDWKQIGAELLTLYRNWSASTISVGR